MSMRSYHRGWLGQIDRGVPLLLRPICRAASSGLWECMKNRPTSSNMYITHGDCLSLDLLEADGFCVEPMVLVVVLQLVEDEDRSYHILSDFEGDSAGGGRADRVVIYPRGDDVVAEDYHRNANPQKDEGNYEKEHNSSSEGGNG